MYTSTRNIPTFKSFNVERISLQHSLYLPSPNTLIVYFCNRKVSDTGDSPKTIIAQLTTL